MLQPDGADEEAHAAEQAGRGAEGEGKGALGDSRAPFTSSLSSSPAAFFLSGAERLSRLAAARATSLAATAKVAVCYTVFCVTLGRAPPPPPPPPARISLRRQASRCGHARMLAARSAEAQLAPLEDHLRARLTGAFCQYALRGNQRIGIQAGTTWC
ncbi:hypothetical protein T492DRAFT_875706 [Pavlovales sp. CCMP2436]|nr:hypothetical protein T492DRAFT_875706 [Pavlovales sp. CCMP2436]